MNRNVRVGNVISGTVVVVYEDRALVDVGWKMEGTIYKDYYSQEKIADLRTVLKENDKVTVKITKITDSSIYLSRLEIEAEEKKNNLLKKIMKRKPFTAIVSKHVQGGFILNKEGVELFLPDNYVDLDKDFDAMSMIGTEQKVVFVSSNQEAHDVTYVVSRKQVIYKELMRIKTEEFNSINVDDVLEGTVVRLTDFGAFVKFKEVEGLIHITEISHYHIKNPSEILSVGQVVKVKVIKKTDTKLHLSIKALEKTPWQIFVENHKVGDVVETTVVKKSDVFMLCMVERDVVGIINKVDYSWNPEENLAGTVEEGDKLILQITYIDKDKERMTLSKKHLEYNPWHDVHLKPHEHITGNVLRFTNTGAIIKVGNIEGFLPNREASDTNKPASDVLKIGDVVSCEVIRVEPKSWHLSLSIRSIEEKKDRELVDKYLEDNVSSNTSLEDLFNEKNKKQKNN